MTLDEAALETAKCACIDALTYTRYASRLDPITETYRFYETMLPSGYKPGLIIDRAKEMLQSWDRHSTPEIEQEIVDRAKLKREFLNAASPELALLVRKTFNDH